MSGIQVAKGIVHRKGLVGLYAGYSAALLRQILYSGGRIGGFNTVFDMYKELVYLLNLRVYESF